MSQIKIIEMYPNEARNLIIQNFDDIFDNSINLFLLFEPKLVYETYTKILNQLDEDEIRQQFMQNE